MDEWIDVPGYEGLYQITSTGSIRSLLKSKDNPVVLSGTVNKNGYRQMSLCKDGSSKRKLVHRLVAESFIANPNNYESVNHMDGNKLNNDATNLEWCSREQNTKHSYAMGLNGKLVAVKRSDGVVYESVSEAARQTGIHVSSIFHALAGKRASAGGYRWEYTSKPHIERPRSLRAASF